MRYSFGIMCLLALGVMGCSDPEGAGGSGGSGVACVDNVCPCNEAGIRGAIAKGGGPFTFDCNGPTTVEPEADIVIDNDTILDGEGSLTVDGGAPLTETVFSVPKGVNAELRGLTVTRGFDVGITNEGTLTIQDCVITENRSEDYSADDSGGGIFNAGEMTIVDSTVSRNYAGHGRGGGIFNAQSATLELVNSTISDNGADGDGGGLYGGGIFNGGEMTILNSTVSGNTAFDAVFGGGLGGGIANAGSMSLSNSTVSGNSADLGGAIAIDPRFSPDAYTEIANTLIEGECARNGDSSSATWVSKGGNIESPGDTCGFDQTGDQPSVPDPMLGELADNGGPTQTHALLPGSPAINQIPVEDCLDAEGAPLTTDQRGEPRPETGGTMCDVGAFERQTDDP